MSESPQESQARQATSMPRVTRIIPPVYFGIALAAIIALSWIKPWGRLPDVPGLAALGFLLFVAGLGMVWFCGRLFRAAQTPIKPFHATTTLLCEGPYAYSRNPIYAAGIASLLGAALMAGTLSALLVVVVFALLMHYAFVLSEEAVLRETLGSEYQDYCSRVRRWL